MSVDEVEQEQAATGRPDPALLTRLNEHGFRLVMLLDLLGLAALVVAPMWQEFGWSWPDYRPWRYAVSLTLLVLLVLVSTYLVGLYEREPRLGAPSPFPSAVRVAVSASAVFALGNLVATSGIQIAVANEIVPTLLTDSTQRAFPLPTDNLLIFTATAPLWLVATRRLVHLDRQRREGPPRLLLVGTEDEIVQARAHLATVPQHVRVVGATSDVTDLRETVALLEATNVALLGAEWLQALPSTTLAAFDRAGTTVLQRVSALETMYGLRRIREVGGLPFVLLRAQTVPSSRRVYKRLFDLAALVVLGLPGLLLVGGIALYLRAVMGGPVLFRQPRVGRDGSLFTLVKFRTMTLDAEDGTGAVLSSGEGDTRVVEAARWLRDTRLDELPQLWNVLRGEMSLVGPRPERPEMTVTFEEDIPGYARRHELPPGLTGLAQIHGRYHTDAEYKLGYDLQYLVNWSPILDLEILARTVLVVLGRRG